MRQGGRGVHSIPRHKINPGLRLTDFTNDRRVRIRCFAKIAGERAQQRNSYKKVMAEFVPIWEGMKAQRAAA